MAAIGGELLYIGLPNHVSGDLPERTYSALMFTVLWIGFSLILLLCVTHSGSSRR